MTAPTITAISPASGSEIENTQPITFQVNDNGTALLRVLVALQFPGMELWEVVYDGADFVSRFAGTSTATAIVGGVQFSLLRDPVWPDGPRLKVWAINTLGEEATSTSAHWSLLAPTPLQITSAVPVFPAAGSALETNTVSYDADELLAVFDRVMASEWIRPIREKGDGFGYEILRAFAAVGVRTSQAVQALERGLFAIFAEGATRATGVVEFYRAAATAGAVSIKAGSLVQASANGQMFRTLETAQFGGTDLGPVAVAVEAIDVGEEYNVKGQVITPRGETLDGSIDTPFRIFQTNAAGEDDWIDATIQVRQILGVTGGRSPWLDALGQDRGVFRGSEEPDDAYRYRVRTLPDNLTPAAIQRALDALADKWGVSYQFIEVWQSDYQTCFDYFSSETGVPNELSPYPPELVDEAVFTYDDPRDASPFLNRWLAENELRAEFIVVVTAPASIAEYGAHYDSTDMDLADRTTTNGSVQGQFAISAYELASDMPPEAGYAGCYDGFDAGLQGFWRAWWETLQTLKAAGVIAVIELDGQ